MVQSFAKWRSATFCGRTKNANERSRCEGKEVLFNGIVRGSVPAADWVRNADAGFTQSVSYVEQFERVIASDQGDRE